MKNVIGAGLVVLGALAFLGGLLDLQGGPVLAGLVMAGVGVLLIRGGGSGSREVDADFFPGDHELRIAGTSSRQDDIAQAVGAKRPEGYDEETIAALVPEPSNRFDKNAISVQIDGVKVGYLDRNAAEAIHAGVVRHMRKKKTHVAVRARIVGGWKRGSGDEGNFGVRVYVDPDHWT